jgi:RHS repeat-associated protein
MSSAAARELDPIEHESILAAMAGAAANLAVSAVVGFAEQGLCKYAGLALCLLGPVGIVVGVAVMFAGPTLLDMGVEAAGKAVGVGGPGEWGKKLGDAATAKMDDCFPPAPAGLIDEGSPNVFINGRAAARAVPAPEPPPSPPFVPPVAMLALAVAAPGLAVAAVAAETIAGWFAPSPPDDDNTAKCERHTPKQHVAEGSGTVFINGAPAHRVGDHIDCGAKTSCGSQNVFIGGPPLATREISSGMPAWLDLVFRYGGLALALCRGSWKSPLGKVACLVEGMVVSAVIDQGIRSVAAAVGLPVHAATGTKFLDGSEDLDFELPARLPLRWERSYNSMDSAEGPLGPGWRLPVTVTLTASPEGAALTTARGIEVPFGPVGPGESVTNVVYGWTLGRIAAGRWIARDPEGLFYDFGPDRAGTTLPLQSVEDRNGNRIALHYDEAGRLVELVDSADRVYACRYDPLHERRIAEVTWVKASTEAVVLVRYTYDASGRLASVTNRAGEVVRQFTWHDLGAGKDLMASQALPAGLLAHYEWQGFPGSHPRVVRHWTSAGEEWRFSYALAPEGGGTTRVTDHLGRVLTWEWIGAHQITSHKDAIGRSWRWEYDEAHLPVRCIEPDGAAWSHDFDAQGNLIEAVDPLGGRHRTTWRTDLSLPERTIGPDGAETRYHYDERGNLLSVTHPGGWVGFTRDARGAVVAERDERGGISQWVRRDDGQPASYTDCSGKVTRWRYDEQGRLLGKTDALGQATRYAWDEAGRIAGRMTPDGIRQSWRWRRGNFLERMERAGAETRYAWDASGRLASTIDPVGNVVRYEYDPAGQLATLIDGAGQVTRFEYDAADQQVAETGIDGLRTEYKLDARHLPVEVVRAAGTRDALRLLLTRDLVGRLVEKRTDESLTRYAYDAAGRLLTIKRFAPDGETLVDEIGFAYDKVGQLVEETTTIHRLGRRIADSPGRPGVWQWAALPAPRRTAIKHERDALGNIVATQLPHGPELRYLRYGSGHLLQINLGDTVVSEMERDDLHREVSRTQGALETRFGLDPMGRRLSCRVAPAEGSPFGPASLDPAAIPGKLLDKEYRYNEQGLLAQRRDAWLGARRFTYDLAGRITANEGNGPPRATARSFDAFAFGGTSGPQDEAFHWDGASNMLPFDRGLRVVSGETVVNRVLRWGESVYEYDSHGRVTYKRPASGDRLFLTWNSEHQLVRSWSARGGDWTYHYDALGRRIAKQRHDGRRGTETIWFIWDGMRMVQEERARDCITTIYEDALSYVPLARVEQALRAATVRPGQIFHFHKDVNGAPEELTTYDGRLAWRARYQTWGNLALEEWVPSPDPAAVLPRQVQGLRFQGQYHDAETGLHYNTFRYYDPDIGRLVSQDPIGLAGGLNLYQYAPDPISWIDPWGLAGTPTTILGRKVYQDDSLIDPTTPVNQMNINQNALNSPSFDKMKGMIDNGATNVDLMNEGYAPFGPDGNQVNLHHILGEEPGPMIELSASTHQKFYSPLHGLVEDGNSFRNNPSLLRGYNRFRSKYWKERAKGLKCK